MHNMINLWTWIINKILLWVNEIKKIYLGNIVIYDKTWTREEIISLSQQWYWNSSAIWIQIAMNNNCELISVEKPWGLADYDDVNRARIYSSVSWWTLLWTASFVWNVATFTWITLSTWWVRYWVLYDRADGNSFNRQRATRSWVINKTNFNVEYGRVWANWGSQDSSYYYAVSAITTKNI